MSEPVTSTTSSRATSIVVVALLVVVALIVASTLITSAVQTGIARSKFYAAQSSVIHQVEADDDAHAALAAEQGNGFATSAGSVVAALTTCMGSAATSSTKDELSQLAGFDSVSSPARDILPLIDPPMTAAEYLADARMLLAKLTTFRVRTVETRADATAILISEDEVNLDLYAIASSIGGSAVKLVSKDAYATGTVKGAYRKSVDALATEAAAIAPSLESKKTIKVSPADSAALITSLSGFASECQAEAASSRAHKPTSHQTASSGYLSWRLPTWLPESVHVPNQFNVLGNTNAMIKFDCPAESLIAEGTAHGPRGATKTVTVTTSVSTVDFLERWVTATEVQWAFVACKG